jgi:hypothetical protein
VDEISRQRQFKALHIDWTVLRETAMCVSADEGAEEEMTTAITNSTIDRVTAKLAALEQLGPAELKAKWQSVYKTAPPPKMSRALSVRANA